MFPIDAVITWVNGHDPEHQKKLNTYLTSLGISRPENAAPTRFNELGELNYCVKSILKFAPWIRTIFIVTDNQIPPIVQELQGTSYFEKIKIIDHREIFAGFEECLPTFNSLTIETMLWRIPNLAENFIYFNDDFCFLRPMAPEDFFKDDKIILRGEWKTQADKKFLNRLFKRSPEKNTYRYIQEKSAEFIGFSRRFFALPHAPSALKKTDIQNFWQAHPDLLQSNIQYRLRDIKQHWIVSLMHHLALKKHEVIIDDELRAIYIHPAIHSDEVIKKRMEQASQANTAFACIQSIDEASTDMQALLFNWLNEKIRL